MGTDYTTFQPLQFDCGTTTGQFRARPVSFVRPRKSTDPLVERARSIWSAGDYDRIAAGFRHEARTFVRRQNLHRGISVLDAACGSGNLTIPAARTGARVTGFDIVPALLGATADWATREGLVIRLDQGTVEELPYPDAQFDVALSMFGIMFAPRPDRVVRELTRVVRPGGRIALANWTPDGFVGTMLKAHTARVPAPPGLASPLAWGDEATIRERLDSRDWDVRVRRRTLTFRYPHMSAGTADLFRSSYGPTVRTFAALDEQQRADFAAELTDLWARHQKPGALTTEVDSDYLEVVAFRK